MFLEDARTLAKYVLKTSIQFEETGTTFEETGRPEGEDYFKGFVCRICRHASSDPSEPVRHTASCEYHIAERLLKGIENYDAFRSTLLEIS
jgi:hypothetical protein